MVEYNSIIIKYHVNLRSLLLKYWVDIHTHINVALIITPVKKLKSLTYKNDCILLFYIHEQILQIQVTKYLVSQNYRLVSVYNNN